MPDDLPPNPGRPAESSGQPSDASAPAEASARRRLASALLQRPSRGQAAVAVLLAGLGFAGVTQVRATEVDNTYAGYREQALIDLFNTMTTATERSQSQIAELERRKRDLTDSTLQHQTAVSQAQEAADTLAILAGEVPVHGPGLRIMIEETTGEVSVNTMLDTMQELRAAGAEAMEFNDSVRAVAQTSFAPATGGMIVGGTFISAPYSIEVIGDPGTLQSGLTFPTGPIEQLEEDGASVKVEELSDLRIDSIRDPVE